MRSVQIILISFLYLFTGLVAASALPTGDALVRRDEPSSASSNAPPSGSGSSTNLPMSSTMTTATATGSSVTNNGQTSATGGAAPTAASNSTMTSASATPSVTASPGSDDAPLPLQPELSAARAVGGVLLLVSGLIYTFVGIKSRPLQVFVSTAYLTSLAVSVLIVYVETPPVSAGTQGAYAVAIVIPGLILGGVAVVFKDIAEGLGCAIGGFALGMWFMTLRPGGLVTAQAGKIILLCVFTAVGFSFSFSRYTRTYALIGLTAFAGATALLLGIDSFAKAGLIEFWLYIWNLNSNMFPLNTNTYPLTKNLKAEIAGIPIATLFGILSQIQVWKVVQKKREERAEAETRRQRLQEDEEARLGRELEARTQAEKMVWERTYADRPRDTHSDSGIGSEHSQSEKGSQRNSVNEKVKVEERAVSGEDEPTSARHSSAAKGVAPDIIVSVAEEPEELTEIHPSLRVSQPEDEARRNSQPFSDDAADGGGVGLEDGLAKSLQGKSLKPKTIPAPVVIPLPFNVPSGPTTPNTPTTPKEEHDDASSVATAAPSVKRRSKRFSAGSLFANMTKGRVSFHARQKSDTASIQANFDTTDSPRSERFEALSRHTSNNENVNNPSPTITPEMEAKATLPRSPRTDYFGLQSRGEAANSPGLPSLDLDVGSAKIGTGISSEQAKAEGGNDITLNFDSIQANASGTSKVMNKYRTNEWAKHISEAQEPEEDTITYSEPPSPELVSQTEPEESREHEKVELPSAALSDAAPESSDRSVSDAPAAGTAEEQAPKASWPKASARRHSAANLLITKKSQPVLQTTGPVLNRSASREGSRTQPLRSSSGSRSRPGKAREPSRQALTTSPIHEDVETIFPPPNAIDASVHEIQPNSLLAHREYLVSQSSISRSPSAASSYSGAADMNMNGRSASRMSGLQNRSSSSLSHRSSSVPAQDQFGTPRRSNSALSMRELRQSAYTPPPPVRTYTHSPSPDAHPASPPHAVYGRASPALQADRQLGRNSAADDARRSNMLASWRASLADDPAAWKHGAGKHNAGYAEAGQGHGQGWLDMQRQQREVERQRMSAVGWATDRAMSPVVGRASPGPGQAGMMMVDQMQAHEAHREVLRRMQSKSKVKV